MERIGLQEKCVEQLEYPSQAECPNCGEDIHAKAKKCKYCSEWTDSATRRSKLQADAQRDAAEQGDAKAQFQLGLSYHYGSEVEKDYKEACKWWRMAAEQGYVGAQLRLGDAYISGKGVEREETEAVRLWRMAADQGDTEAQLRLGDRCRAIGDAKEACNWWRRAAEKGYVYAQLRLGDVYYSGNGVEKNDVEAINWWRKAAEQGNALAKMHLKRSAT